MKIKQLLIDTLIYGWLLWIAGIVYLINIIGWIL
jgi:hypothetical protein